MGMRHLLNRKEHAYYNTKFVFEEVPNELLPLDYDALARFRERLKRQSQIFTQEKQNTWKSRVGKR